VIWISCSDDLYPKPKITVFAEAVDEGGVSYYGFFQIIKENGKRMWYPVRRDTIISSATYSATIYGKGHNVVKWLPLKIAKK